MCSMSLNMLLLLGCIIKKSNGEFFLVSPGDGENFVYSPVNVNATLHCGVNNTNLVWKVDMLVLGSPVHTLRLRARGIYQTEPVTSSDGVTTSSVTALGRFLLNNNSRICCQSVIESRDIHENCTTLILYGRPSPPQHVTVQYTRGEAKSIMLNISWTATSMMGVDQNYAIHFKSHIHSETTVSVTVTDFYYIHQINTFATRCGEFLAFIKTVNGAGESDPSNNLTIPSLPDIGPVTASLSHQVWKSTGGEIMVNVSFKQARYCIEYPLLSYTLMLRSQQTGSLLNLSINSNETKVVNCPENSLEDNQKYEYAVTAINEFGNTTSHEDGKWKYLFTSDVQSVTATVVGESTIDIQCLFINGSDAEGCKVVLVSRCPTVEDKHVTLLRMEVSSTSTNQTLKLIHNISCYHRVLAADIDFNNTIRNLTIEGRIVNEPKVNDANKGDNQLPIAVIVPVLSFIILVILVLAVSLIIMIKGKCNVQGLRSESTARTRKRWFKQTREMTRNEVCGISTDGIETTPSEVYGVSTECIETTPNEVYGVSTAAIQHSTEVLRNSTECQVYEHIN